MLKERVLINSATFTSTEVMWGGPGPGSPPHIPGAQGPRGMCGTHSFNFSPFFEAYASIHPDKPLPSPSFLEWFIGFTEGDGCFARAKRGDLQFVVTQSTLDVQILNLIKENLGFGAVILQSKKQRTHRYIVQDLESLYLMCMLFNGNLVFPIRSFKFSEFLSALNTKLVKRPICFAPPIVPKLATVLPTLKDFWLSGFTDAEGCFTVSILSGSKSARIRFILSQKWDNNKPVLEHILGLFDKELNQEKSLGAVVPHREPGNYELRINGIKNCQHIQGYFNAYALKSKKSISYNKWKSIHTALSRGEHLDKDLRENLVELSKDVNRTV